MKKIYLVLLIACMSIVGRAQDTETQQPSEKHAEKIEALEVAFITKELDLTPEEAQQFWPVYNQYSKEVIEANKETDVIAREEKILNIKKKYQAQFTKVLGTQQRTNKMFEAKNKFRKLLIKKLQERQMKRGLKNRPGLRGN